MKRPIIFACAIITVNMTAYAAQNDEPAVWIAACPVCDCDAARANAEQNNTSYAGVRVYQNARAVYAYTPIGGVREKDAKDNLGFGTTMGLRFNKWLRGEYETLYMGAQYTAEDQSFEYDIWANMLNGYLYWEFQHTVAPYIGGGVGLTAIWGSINGELSNATDISYQGLIGVLFELGPHIELEVGYKYINFGKISHSGGTTRVDETQFYLGAIYRF